MNVYFENALLSSFKNTYSNVIVSQPAWIVGI